MDARHHSKQPATAEEARGPNNPHARPSTRVLAAAGLAAGLTALAAGCSLVVMTAKSLFGDPVVISQFKAVTKVDLARSQKKVAVVCTVPAAVESEYPSVGRDILEQVTLRLKREGLRVISAETVLDWLDDHAGVWSEPDELAEAFDADYIIHFELVEFTHKVENSPQLYQGSTRGYIRVYRTGNRGGRRKAEEIFTDEDFRSVYPEHGPQPAGRTSGEHFLREYIKRISTQLAQKFYDHSAAESVY